MDNKNKTLRRILHGGHATWKEGGFFVWNIPGMIMPLYTYIEIINTFKQQQGLEVDKILYSIAEKQAVIGADYQREKFGVLRPLDIINAVLDQIEMIGFGVIKIVQLDFQTGRGTFVGTVSPFAKYFRELYGSQERCADAYISGLLAGGVEGASNIALTCIETKCIARGDSVCTFELFAQSALPKEFESVDLSLHRPLDEIRKDLSKEKVIASRTNK